MPIIVYALLCGVSCACFFFYLSYYSPQHETDEGAESEGEPDPFDDDDGDEDGDPLWRNGVLTWGGEGPKQHRPVSASTQLPFIILSFLAAVVWIMILANELVAALETLGLVLGVSDTILGATVLAWGNSVGDLVADVSVARKGYPEMALAGAYAGPMFNLLVGLGLAMSYLNIKNQGQTGGPGHGGGAKGLAVQEGCLLYINFGFLLLSLVTAIAIVPNTKWRITRRHGWFLIGVYGVYMAVSIAQQLSLFKHCLPIGS